MVSTFDLLVIRERARVRARMAAHRWNPAERSSTLWRQKVFFPAAPASAFLLVAISSVQKFHQTANNRRLLAPFEDWRLIITKRRVFDVGGNVGVARLIG